MKFEGEITVDAPRPRVFEEMQTPAMLNRTIPNCQRVDEISDGRYRATIEEKISQLSLTMDTEIEITELRDPEFVEITITGSSKNGNTSAEGIGSFDLLEENGGDRTAIHYTLEINVSGKLASLGFKMLKHVVTSRIDQMVDNIETAFENGDTPETAAPE